MIGVLNTMGGPQMAALQAMMGTRAVTAHEAGVQGATMWAMEQRGLVDVDRDGDPALYTLSTLGRAVLDCLTGEPELVECERPIARIQREVANHFHIPLIEMISARRSRAVARPRQVAMYLAKQLTTLSLPNIGKHFGNRDHTTVIHAVRQIENLMYFLPVFRADVQFLRDKLQVDLCVPALSNEMGEEAQKQNAKDGSAKLLTAMLALAA